MAPSYHSDVAERARKVLANLGHHYMDRKPYLLTPQDQVISLIWEMLFLIEADDDR